MRWKWIPFCRHYLGAGLALAAIEISEAFQLNWTTMASNNTQSDSEAVLKDSQSLLEQLQGLQEVLTNASSKNETLLEAVETAEMKAVQSGNNEVMLQSTDNSVIGIRLYRLYILQKLCSWFYLLLLLLLCLVVTVADSPCTFGCNSRSKLQPEERPGSILRFVLS